MQSKEFIAIMAFELEYQHRLDRLAGVHIVQCRLVILKLRRNKPHSKGQAAVPVSQIDAPYLIKLDNLVQW